MRIAIPYRDGEVFLHFGRSEYFKLYDIENGEVVHEEIVATDGVSHGALAVFLDDLDVSVVLCGGMGENMRSAMLKEGIEIYGGIRGDADDAAEDFIHGELSYVYHQDKNSEQSTAACSHRFS